MPDLRIENPLLALQWNDQKQQLHLAAPEGPQLTLPPAGVELEFTDHRQTDFPLHEVIEIPEGIRFSGGIPESNLRWEVNWTVTEDGWCRKEVVLTGEPPAAWGTFRRLVVMRQPLPTGDWDDQMGWREHPMAAGETEALRPVEEGAGRLPACGYPVFGEWLFAGLEHPMGFNRVTDGTLEMFHHPRWSGGPLRSFPAVLGFTRKKETAAGAFQRYLGTIRRPAPSRALVEVNTFWTDPYGPDAKGKSRYSVSREGYLSLIREWTDRVLQGQPGLLSSLMLDAGWQELASLYQPQASIGGPGLEGLAELAAFMTERGLTLGLWWSWNGPIGIDADWAEAEGFRVSDRGEGATYGTAGGTLRYECLTDPQWEEAIGGRLQELLSALPVRGLKEDWSNVGIIDPALFPGEFACLEQMWEANVEAMIRLGTRARTRQPDIYWRGGQWPSPWWLMHVDSLHLANSGDCEAADLPALTQRDAIMTSRDALLHHHAVTCRTPIPWDAWTLHEFAAAPRNPVGDTDESWLNNLLLWISRGTHHLTIYMPPYDLHGWRAWTFRETLRWLRAEEDLLWRSPTRMVGGSPQHGEVYGFLHEDGERSLLTLRNPVGFPRKAPPLESLGLSPQGWSRIYPTWEPWEEGATWMPSNAVCILVRGDSRWQTDRIRLRAEKGWMTPFGQEAEAAIPAIHRIPKLQAQQERLDAHRLLLHAEVPFGVQELEWIFCFSTAESQALELRAGLSRYPDGHASAPLPVTWLRSHWTVGYGQGRLGWSPYDQSLRVARIPGATGGTSHLLLQSHSPLPDPTPVWAEWREQSLPHSTEDPETGIVPPSLPFRSRALLVDGGS